jgi:hypothetical protein
MKKAEVAAIIASWATPRGGQGPASAVENPAHRL